MEGSARACRKSTASWVNPVKNEKFDNLIVAATRFDDAAVLSARGVLDSSTYHLVRDQIIKAALDEPRAVIVDVTNLEVPAESAWVVFTSARWHVDRWPSVPIMLVCDHLAGRSAIARNGVTRYVPVYPTLLAATDALAGMGPTPLRRRARAALPAELSSVYRSREFVSELLTAWSQTAMIPVAKVVVTTLVENVLQHTDSRPGLRLEFDGSNVTVAVDDANHEPAGVHESTTTSEALSGLRIVASLCRAWGNSPTTSGKTVWAVIGPENIL